MSIGPVDVDHRVRSVLVSMMNKTVYFVIIRRKMNSPQAEPETGQILGRRMSGPETESGDYAERGSTERGLSSAFYNTI